jgi:hypothetical protein
LQLASAEPLLQAGQEGILLVADVLSQDLDQPVQDLASPRGVQVLAIEDRDQLVDLLVLLLHLPGEDLAVRKHAPDDGPQD